MTVILRFIMAFVLVVPFITQSRLAFGGNPLDEKETGLNEKALTQKVRENRLSREQLILLGENIPYLTKLKLYFYAKELEPFFLGLEDSIRNLARVEPSDKAALFKAKEKLSQVMRLCRDRLAKDKQRDLEKDWLRGLTGLIFLDQNWRKRVYDQNKKEIKNPYDLVALLDCMDARIRGVEQGEAFLCPCVIKKINASHPLGKESKKQ